MRGTWSTTQRSERRELGDGPEPRARQPVAAIRHQESHALRELRDRVGARRVGTHAGRGSAARRRRATRARRAAAGVRRLRRPCVERGQRRSDLSGENWATGQSPAPGSPWPRFVIKSLTRSVNYETASVRDVWVRTQGEDPPRGGGVQPVRGEQRQVFVVSGDHAWNVVNDAAI